MAIIAALLAVCLALPLLGLSIPGSPIFFALLMIGCCVLPMLLIAGGGGAGQSGCCHSEEKPRGEPAPADAAATPKAGDKQAR